MAHSHTRYVSLVLIALLVIAAVPAAADDGSTDDGGHAAPAVIEDAATRDVPWKQGARKPVAFASATAALERTISESELETLFTQTNFDPKNPTVVDLLARYPLLGLDNIERFARRTREIDWKDVTADPSAYTGEIFRLRGRVRKVRRTELLPEVAQGFEFDHFYLVDIEVQENLPAFLVCARDVPEAWARDTPIDELASCYAMLLHTNELPEGDQQLVMLAERVAWHPDRLDAARNIGPAQLLLSKLGMDLGLFDEVRSNNGRETVEPEAFHQLLAALKRSSNDELRKSTEPFDLSQLLATPQTQHGNLVMVEGVAQRVQKIDIQGSYYSRRIGIDHYYEVHVAIALDRPVKLTYAKGKTIEYAKSFPVAVNVLRIPPELKEGAKTNQRVRIPCVYFKLWAYDSKFVRREEGRMQLSPLLAGIEPTVVTRKRAANPYVAGGVIAVIALALAGLWIGLWRTSRKDHQFQRQQVERQFEVQKGKSLNTMGIEASDEPDFSKLD